MKIILFITLMVKMLPFIQSGLPKDGSLFSFNPAERILHNGPKVYIKSAALASRQRDLYEVYLTPFRYIEKEMRAIATINGLNNIHGIIYLTQAMPPAGMVSIRGNLTGLKAGKHGIHISELGDISNSCLSTGSHYNPYNFTHGPPNIRHRHLGDLGNIEVNEDGTAMFAVTDKLLTLTGTRSIIGRSIVITEKEDDLGQLKNKESLTTGNSGLPIACGVIGRN